MILVGCPVKDREWMMERWFEHVALAASKTDHDIEYVFVGDRRDKTVTVINEICDSPHFVHVDEDVRVPYSRNWSQSSRLEHMVVLRNLLLGKVREVAPDYFLSLDSDILLQEDVLQQLLETAPNYDAVGGKAYLTPKGTKHPTYAYFTRKGFSREDSSQVMAVDVIMAIKLMTPAAYAVDYEFHSQGEDLGWSKACTARGLKLGWDGRSCSKHIMHDPRKVHHFTLDTIDQRVGF